MPWFAYIHPLLAIFTLGFGLSIGQLSLSRLGDWDFPLRHLRFRTLLYFILTVVNLGIGLFVDTLLGVHGRAVKLLAHLPLAIAVAVLALLALLVTYGKSRKPGELAPALRLYPMLIIASLALIMTMGFTALLKVLKI
jgi:hypothetical protein